MPPPLKLCEQYRKQPKTARSKMQSHLLSQFSLSSPQIFGEVQRDQRKVQKDHKVTFQESQGRICEQQYVEFEINTSVGII